MCTEETHRENSLFYAPNSITTSSYVAPAAATPIRYQTPTLICEAQSENLSTDCRRPGEEHVCSFARQTYNQHTHVHKFQFFKQGANPTKTAITHCHPPIPTRTITMQLDQWTLAYFSLAFDWKLIPSLEHIVGMVLVSLGWFTEGRLIFTYIPARLNRRFKVSLRITLTSNAAFSLSRPIFHSSYCFFFSLPPPGPDWHFALKPLCIVQHSVAGRESSCIISFTASNNAHVQNWTLRLMNSRSLDSYRCWSVTWLKFRFSFTRSLNCEWMMEQVCCLLVSFNRRKEVSRRHNRTRA